MKTKERSINLTCPILYKKAGDGVRMWRTWSDGAYTMTEFGKIGGKLQVSTTKVAGKNVGRSNETTAAEQAAIHAQQLHDAKIKEGFTPDLNLARRCSNVMGGPQVMLAHVWEDYFDRATFPAYVQPKLDGLRCAAQVLNGKCTLYSRSQKIIATLPHLNEEVLAIAKVLGRDVTLDGELYNHALHDDFGAILGAVKRGSVGENADKIQYHVYDIIGSTLTFAERYRHYFKALWNTVDPADIPHIVRVATTMVKDSADLMKAHYEFTKLGYEGVMYRRADGLYEPKRSTGLLKVKLFRDDEFKVTGSQNGTGKLDGYVGSWICVTDSGKEFRAKQEGALKDIPKFHSPAARAAVGQWLTVRYQNLTKDGVPRFPVAVRFRRAE